MLGDFLMVYRSTPTVSEVFLGRRMWMQLDSIYLTTIMDDKMAECFNRHHSAKPRPFGESTSLGPWFSPSH